MNKISLALIASISILLFACGIFSSTDVDFSIVPVKGSNGEFQYIDLNQKGKIVINPQFGEAHIFRDGLALVKAVGRDGKYGYIDKKGKYVVPPTYDYAQDFSEGMAWVQLENQPPMLIDNKGKILMRIDSLTRAYPFVNDMAKISYYSQGQKLEGFMNKKGEIVIAAMEGEKINFMNDGLYAFKSNASQKWGFKNKQGEIVINEQFDSVGVFIDGIVEVKVGDKWGVINKKGDYIVNPQYDGLSYDNDGMFWTKTGKKYGWINKKGETVINPQFDDIHLFYKNKLAPVKMGKWAYIDKKGQIVINPQFDDALSFFGDYALVANDHKIGFINLKGEYVVQPLYAEDIDNVIDYLCAFEQNLYGFTAFSEFIEAFQSYERLNEKIEEYREKEREKARAAAEKERAIAEEKAEKARAEAKASTSSFTDSRDDVTYKHVKIGNQVWMAENLNYAESGECYKKDPANCQKYGKYFSWAEAKKACPSGWHLPSNAEWDALYRLADGNSGTESPYKSETAGKQLKAASGWNPFNGESGNGEDAYGFAALPGGSFYSGYNHAGNNGYWWSASEYDDDKAYYRFMLYDGDGAGWNKNTKSLLLNVRCVRD